MFAPLSDPPIHTGPGSAHLPVGQPGGEAGPGTTESHMGGRRAPFIRIIGSMPGRCP